MSLFRYSKVIGVFAVVLSIVVSVPASAVTAPFSGKNGSIAYVKSRGGTNDIWTIQPDGSRNKRLARDGHSPVWSPDGHKLAFVSGDAIQIINASGTGRRTISHMPGQAMTPRWSYDGSQLAFVQRQEHSGRQRSAIYTVKANGWQLVNRSGWASNGAGYRAPSWSPDSGSLLYEQYGTSFRGLKIKNLRTGQATALVEITDPVTSSNAAWSPSGLKIMYNDSDTAVYTISPDGSQRTVISDGESMQASWSPDGHKIVFLEDPSDDHISVSEKDGTIVWLPVEKGQYITLGTPSWSPDGRKILFIMANEQGAALFIRGAKESSASRQLVKGPIIDATWQSQLY